NAMRLVGTSGTMDVNLFHGFVLSQSGAVSWGRKVAQPFTYGAGLVAVAAGNLLLRAWRWEPAYPGLRSLVRRFYAAAACGGDPPISRAEVVAAARAYEQLTQLLGGEATAKSDSGRA